ncbi:MAG: hypothetical protein KGS49_06025 [Planctomycetes bacterium]|nr:hypothetical protein [Planctomycetota bacterium]
MPNPHRISLARAWTPIPNPSCRFALQRFFQKPTNLGEETRVQLKVVCHGKLQDAYLNGQPLVHWNSAQLNSEIPDLHHASQVEAENSQEFGYDWQIAAALKTRNELVLCWPTSDSHPPVSPPKFEVWLEIFDP